MQLACLPLVLILNELWMTSGQQGSAPYYGLPLGSVFYSTSATQGEVYASEPRKLLVRNFQHGAEPGCTAFMVGPPVAGINVSVSPNNEGILLAVETKPRRRLRRQIQTNSTNSTNGNEEEGVKAEKTGDGATIVQLGTLPKQPEPDLQNGSKTTSESATVVQLSTQPKSPTPTEQPDDQRSSSGPGIIWGDQVQPLQQKQKQQQQQQETANAVPGLFPSERGGIRWADLSEKKQLAPSVQPPKVEVVRFGGGDQAKTPPPKLRELPIEYVGGINVPDEKEGKNETNVTALLKDPFNPELPLVQTRSTESTRSFTILFGGERSSDAPISSDATVAPTVSTSQEPQKTFRGLPVTVAASEPAAAPAAVEEPPKPNELDFKTATGENENRTECGNGWCVVPDPRRRTPAPEGPIATPGPIATSKQPGNDTHLFFPVNSRRAQFLPPEILAALREGGPEQIISRASFGRLDETKPARGPNEPIKRTTDEPLKRTTDEPLKRTTDEPLKRTTDEPLKRTTDEPLKRTTDEPLEARTSKGPDQSIARATDGPLEKVRPANGLEQPIIRAPDGPVVEAKVGKSPEALPVLSAQKQESVGRFPPPELPQDGKTYILPRFNGENVVVLLPEAYELSGFQWFGIYDFCTRARTAFVSVRGVQPPKEAKLEGIRGWQYDVSSGDIYVKNCNTLEITNFTFSGAGKTEAYIYIGNGAFPHSIIQKTRAFVDGTHPDRSLKNYSEDNITVRLPPGWKTFDVTWIAVFNPKGNVSYGHVLVPPLVVPPCDETTP